MFAFVLLAGFLVIIYCLAILAIKILMLCNNCAEEDAKKMIADWWQGNVSGQPKIAYELSNDNNYSREVYSSVEGIIGEARYNELCKLDEWSRALVFNDRHSGYPTVQITVNSSDKSEARRLQRILESITRRHILSYGDPANAKVLSFWSKDRVLCLPMLIIAYSRNGEEKAMLDRIEQDRLNELARRCAVRQGNFRV
jgi:hypothetical protein